MVDEKQPAQNDDVADDDAAENAEIGAAPAETPWGESGADAIEAEAEEPAKSRGRWGSLAALVILALVAAGLYLAWPVLQPRLLALLPAAASQTLEAVQALDHRVAQLEAANKRLDQTVATVKSTMAALSSQLEALSQAVSGGEVLTSLREKLSGLEESMAQLGQMAGENGAAALAALTAEVDSLKNRLTGLASSPPDGPPDEGTNTQEIAVLAQQTAALAGENEELRRNLAALQARLEQLEQTAQQTALAHQKSGAGEGLVLTVGQLRQAVLAGGPYTAALAAVTALGGDDAALQAAAAALSPMAKDGIVTLRALSDRFSSMTRDVLQADLDESNGFWRRTLHKVTSLVTVRRVGEVDGVEVDAILARAERRLEAGELAAAANLIAGLDGPAGEAAADWLGRAKARLAALAALADLESRAITRLSDG